MEWLPCQAAKLATTTLQGLIMKLWWSSASLNTQSDHKLHIYDGKQGYGASNHTTIIKEHFISQDLMWNIHATIFDEVGWFFDLQLQSEFVYKEFHSHFLLFLIRGDVIRITVKKTHVYQISATSTPRLGVDSSCKSSWFVFFSPCIFFSSEKFRAKSSSIYLS